MLRRIMVQMICSFEWHVTMSRGRRQRSATSWCRCAQMDIGADEGRRSLMERQREHEALLAADLEQSAKAFQTRREVHESGRKQRSYALSHPAPSEPRLRQSSSGRLGPQSLLPSKVGIALEVSV